MAYSAITSGTDSVVNGRLLALNAATTILTNTITKPPSTPKTAMHCVDYKIANGGICE
jgi:hypothetical protein